MTEDVPTGWDLADPKCSSTESGDTSTPANINLNAGETITCTFTNTQKRGNIMVEKVTEGGTGTFDFTTGSLPGGGFSLTTNGTGTANKASKSFDNLTKGTYGVAETVPTGWDLATSTCSSTDSGDASTPANINLNAGETVTCTFTNTKQGLIKIDKVTDPSGDTTSFPFTLKGGPSALDKSFNLADTTAPNETAVKPGNQYVAAEGEVTGWDLTNTSCSDPTNNSTVGNIDVAPGETVTCTFNNTQRGQIKIDKVTHPPGDTTSFPFTLTGGPSGLDESFALKDQDPVYSSPLVKPGSGYNAAEGSVTGWDLDQANTKCSDDSPVNNINVSPGETVTCTFKNVQQRGKILVDKVTKPGDDPQLFNFKLRAARPT